MIESLTADQREQFQILTGDHQVPGHVAYAMAVLGGPIFDSDDAQLQRRRELENEYLAAAPEVEQERMAFEAVFFDLAMNIGEYFRLRELANDESLPPHRREIERQAADDQLAFVKQSYESSRTLPVVTPGPWQQFANKAAAGLLGHHDDTGGITLTPDEAEYLERLRQELNSAHTGAEDRKENR